MQRWEAQEGNGSEREKLSIVPLGRQRQNRVGSLRKPRRQRQRERR